MEVVDISGFRILDQQIDNDEYFMMLLVDLFRYTFHILGKAKIV